MNDDTPLTPQEAAAFAHLHGATLWQDGGDGNGLYALRRGTRGWWVNLHTDRDDPFNIITLADLSNAFRHRGSGWWPWYNGNNWDARMIEVLP